MAFFSFAPQSRLAEDLLRGFLAGVDHVLGLLQAFVEGRVVEQAVFLFEDRQHGLARGRGPAAEHGGDVVVDQQLLGLLGKGGPVGRAVFLDDLDLAAQDAAHGVDLVDGELFGLDGAGLGDRHGAGGRVQLAYRDLGVRDGQLGGVDLGGRELLRQHQRRDAGQRRHGQQLQQPAARGWCPEYWKAEEANQLTCGLLEGWEISASRCRGCVGMKFIGRPRMQEYVN